MELRNKKVFFLGDSITEGVGTSAPQYTYPKIFEKISGAIVKNYGVAGTRIAVQTNKTMPEWDYNDFIARVGKMENDADAIVVFGGTNDYGHGDAAFGNFESRESDTFYGALHTLCEKLLNRYPNADIIFLTPLHRLGEENESETKPVLSRYVDAVKEVAGYYGLPVLDLFRTSGIQPKTDIIKEIYMPDGLHPSDAGAKRVAERIYGFLKTL